MKKKTFNETMLTVRMTKQLFDKLTKSANKHSKTRSDYVREIIQKELDVVSRQSYKF